VECLFKNDWELAEKRCKFYKPHKDEKWALFAVIHAPINTYNREGGTLCLGPKCYDIDVKYRYNPVDEFAIKISPDFPDETIARAHFTNISTWMKNVQIRKVE